MIARSLAIVVCAAATTLAAQGNAPSQPPSASDTAFTNAVQRLLIASGARSNMRTVIDGMIDTYQHTMPQVPAEFWQEMRVDFNVDTLIALEIPIYKKYLTIDDVRAISAFYETPVGKRLLAAQPMILQESMAVGRQWGEEVGRKIVEKARAKGYIKSS